MFRALFRLFLTTSVPGVRRSVPAYVLSATKVQAVVCQPSTIKTANQPPTILLNCASVTGLNGASERFELLESLRNTVLPDVDAFEKIGLPNTIAETFLSLMADWKARGISVVETRHPQIIKDLLISKSQQLEDDFHTILCIENNAEVEDCIERLTTAHAEGDMLAISYLKYLHSTRRKFDQRMLDIFCMPWLTSSAVAGDDFAQYLLALYYAVGKGEVEQNWMDAFRYFKAAADQGHAQAQFYTARCYFSGNGTVQSDTSAVHYYQLAAAQGHADAQYRLAQCHEKGWGIVTNQTSGGATDSLALLEKSVPYYITAAENGQAEAQYFLAKYHQHKNETEYHRYLHMAADQDHLGALRRVLDSFSDDPESAAGELKYNKAAADLGDPACQFNTGYAYRHGEGTEKDFGEALKYLHMGAAQGNMEAIEELGEMYQEGEGVQANIPNAAHWFKIAADDMASFSRSYFHLRRLESEGKIPEL